MTDSNVSPGLSRASFLKLLAATGVGASVPLVRSEVAQAAGGAPPPGRRALSALSPLDLHFTVRDVHRPFALLERRFITLDDCFGRDGVWQTLVPFGQFAARVRRRQGMLSISSSDGPAAAVLRSRTVPKSPYTVVIADVDEVAPGASVAAGLVKDADNAIVARYDPVSTTISIEVTQGGALTTLARATADVDGCPSGAANDVLQRGHTQGQSFTAMKPFVSVSADFSTSGTTDSHVTFSLYRNGPGGELVARRRIALVTDSTWWRLDLDTPAGPGEYYLEQSEASGTPGWWSSGTENFAGGSAYLDGQSVAGDRLFTVSYVAPMILPFRLALAYTGDSVAAWTQQRNGDWTLVAEATVAPQLDLRDERLLPHYRPGIAVAADNNARAVMSRVQAGYMGQVGVRDLCVVTSPDGRPYIRGRKLYLTGTAAGLASNAANHMAVYALHLDDYQSFEAVARLYFRRDGKVVGDVAGKLVLDERGMGARLFASTWGTSDVPGPIDITLSPVSRDVLSGVHVLDVGRTIWSGGYDPDPTLIGGRWYMPIAGVTMVVYDNDEFTEPTSYTPVPGLFFEGPRLQKVGGSWYVFYGGVEELRIYDLGLNEVGLLDAPHPNGPGYPFVNPPHLMVTPIPISGGRTKFILVTFNGKTDPPGVGLGELVIMDAAPIESGREF